MVNLIRLKQIDQPDLSGFFNTAFIQTGILNTTFVDKFTDQNISGVKTFIDGVNLNNIDNLSLSGVDISIINANIALTNRPTVNGVGVLLNGEAASLPVTIVYTTGDQTISGVKTFARRPTVNGTGILLSGEATVLPTTIVYTTGDQTISGVKTFATRPTVNGTGILLSGEATVLPTTIVYTTGDQAISGVKTFVEGINLNNIQNLILSGLDITITSGDVNLTNRPTVNGTGVLLIGEASSSVLPNTIVYTTGDQTISGVKTFATRPTVNGAGVLLIGEASSSVLPNTIVYTTGDQTISGVKTFATGVNISGHVGIGINSNDFHLYVRKSSAGAANPDSGSIAVFEGSGNSHITVLASNAQTAGVVLGSPADNFGSYLSWNHDNNLLKLATAKPSGFIQILTDNERVAVTITSSGNVNFTNRPTVNNTGVLLSGQNSFTFVLTHSSSTLGSGFNYFGLNDAGYSSASAGSRRRMPILETCEIRKASWSHVVGTIGSPATILSTGYIINTSSNPRQTGIVSTVIDSASDTNPGHYITNFSPSISVISGDLIVAALAVTGFTTAPLQVRDTVVLYCYN